jgi:hypothetical protein
MQACYQGPADKRWAPAPEFSVGSEAYVHAEFFHVTQPSKKLTDKYLGPFKIIAQPGLSSFTLVLPDHMHTVHPVFHVSMLKLHTPSSIPHQTSTPPPPVKVVGEPEYEIEHILDKKINQWWHDKLIYIVKWLGNDKTSELPSTELANAQELVTEFHSMHLDKPGPHNLCKFLA